MKDAAAKEFPGPRLPHFNFTVKFTGMAMSGPRAGLPCRLTLSNRQVDIWYSKNASARRGLELGRDVVSGRRLNHEDAVLLLEKGLI